VPARDAICRKPTSNCRLGLALLLGAAIGFERQWNQKTAGLRTNALVALGASGFVVFSTLVGEGDPTRVAAQVVSGIGFLGAGIILREGINVHGLNTAATLWCSAMVGTFAGGGYWRPSIAAAAFVIVTNPLLRPLIWHLNRRAPIFGDAETHYSIEITCRGAEEAHTARCCSTPFPKRSSGCAASTAQTFPILPRSR
jgi:putative Mg2+ transporter-C (MgtC) family protein